MLRGYRFKSKFLWIRPNSRKNELRICLDSKYTTNDKMINWLLILVCVEEEPMLNSRNRVYSWHLKEFKTLSPPPLTKAVWTHGSSRCEHTSSSRYCPVHLTLSLFCGTSQLLVIKRDPIIKCNGGGTARWDGCQPYSQVFFFSFLFGGGVQRS